MLVLLPTLAPILLGEGGSVADAGLDLVVAAVKLVAFASLMLVVGVRLMPRVLEWVERGGSRELFTLAVLSIPIGIAWAAYAVFGVSFALGAFRAGVVLFFVSVGMLFDPATVVEQTVAIVLMTLLVVVAKSLTAFAIVVLFRQPLRVALTAAAALSQVGEFSFIRATLGLSLGLIPDDAFQLVVVAALVSITLNPFLFRLVEPVEAWLRQRAPSLVRGQEPGPDAA